MSLQALFENRKLKRFIISVKVFEKETGSILGYTENMHTEAMILTSEKQIPIEKEFRIKLEYVQDDNEIVEIPLVARSVWSKLSKNLDYYSTGFRFIDSTPIHVQALELLIDELSV